MHERRRHGPTFHIETQEIQRILKRVMGHVTTLELSIRIHLVPKLLIRDVVCCIRHEYPCRINALFSTRCIVMSIDM